jgi:hypothetical protein
MRKQDSREVDIEEISDKAKRRVQQRYVRKIRAGGKSVSSSQ